MSRPARCTQSDTEPLVSFVICVQSGQFAVRDAMSQILAGLAPLALDPEETGTIEMALTEVLNNVVEHAYPPEVAPGPIHVTCAHRPDGLLVLIKDQGKAMPDGQLPLGELAALEADIDSLPEGGFGWYMIRSLAKEIAYKRIGSENHTSIRLAVGTRQ